MAYHQIASQDGMITHLNEIGKSCVKRASVLFRIDYVVQMILEAAVWQRVMTESKVRKVDGRKQAVIE